MIGLLARVESELIPRVHCRHCGRMDDLIQGDGPVIVCGSCVRALGGLANDPNEATEHTLAVMQERHGDVVLLARTAGQPSRLVWDWIAPWPGVEAH